MTVHHVGYLVRSIDRAAKTFAALGYVPQGDTTRDESRKIDILFMANGDTRIELVAPYERGSAVGNLRKRIGSAPYHICYETENLEKEIASLTENGYVLTSAAMPAPAIDGRCVAFLLHPAIGLIELVEK
ncbi:MAG: VOC family protein [Clostridia bacterium]|nr:VOC family protein [Clostridia bacterium]